MKAKLRETLDDKVSPENELLILMYFVRMSCVGLRW